MPNKAITNLSFVLLGMIALSLWLLSETSSANAAKGVNSQTSPLITVQDAREIAPGLARCVGDDVSDPWLATLRTLFSGTGAFDSFGS